MADQSWVRDISDKGLHIALKTLRDSRNEDAPEQAKAVEEEIERRGLEN